MSYRTPPFPTIGRLHGRLLITRCQSSYITFSTKNVGSSSRIQQQHPQPRAWGAFGLCVVSSKTGCSSQWWMVLTEMSILCQNFQNHQRGAVYETRPQKKTRFGIVKVKASGIDWTRFLRPKRPASLLTSRSIEVFSQLQI